MTSVPAVQRSPLGATSGVDPLLRIHLWHGEKTWKKRMFIFLFPSIFGGTGCRTGGVEDVRCGKKRLKFYVYFKYEKTTRYMWPYGEKRFWHGKKRTFIFIFPCLNGPGCRRGGVGNVKKSAWNFTYILSMKNISYMWPYGEMTTEVGGWQCISVSEATALISGHYGDRYSFEVRAGVAADLAALWPEIEQRVLFLYQFDPQIKEV